VWVCHAPAPKQTGSRRLRVRQVAFGLACSRAAVDARILRVRSRIPKTSSPTSATPVAEERPGSSYRNDPCSRSGIAPQTDRRLASIVFPIGNKGNIRAGQCTCLLKTIVLTSKRLHCIHFRRRHTWTKAHDGPMWRFAMNFPDRECRSRKFPFGNGSCRSARTRPSTKPALASMTCALAPASQFNLPERNIDCGENTRLTSCPLKPTPPRRPSWPIPRVERDTTTPCAIPPPRAHVA
jgi:hypothetical protein